MEIRDPIHGSLYFSDAEVSILDSREFQRLRAIKQLGFAEFSFPGATHNRYLHSLGVSHLTGLIFDSIFRVYPFSKTSIRQRLRQTVRLASLLHDVGHGPLSHTTEQVMPPLKDLAVGAYKSGFHPAGLKANEKPLHDLNRQSNHEDYTIKFVTESSISEIIKGQFQDISPYHVACLIDKTLPCHDDFFMDSGFDFRPILSQIVSSELDADRMDYLERDSYFCGTNYGKIDTEWLIQNLTFHRVEEKVYLALNRRGLYSFDDFLISRHHMFLMVYFHHKSIIFEEMLNRYFSSKECQFFIPASSEQYTYYNDYKLYEHLATQKNIWAERISQRKPFKVLLEMHNTSDSPRPQKIKTTLEKAGIDVIWASSKARLSKYHSGSPEDKALAIYVVDQYDPWVKPSPIYDSTEIFQKYEGARIIDRLYVAPEKFSEAEDLIKKEKY